MSGPARLRQLIARGVVNPTGGAWNPQSVAIVGAGRIEASQQSRWFRFTDDIVIRVASDEVGSRVDMRSTSRQGRGDFGVNAARIRTYMSALRQRIG
jgi:uncharacterized protein (DUF1499 family)